uniref:(northern house mosquito) hypothetical protein n=1 Tax=Culex pipiens TaxID=7175 RepID=A0A8D8FWC1_CULPI
MRRSVNRQIDASNAISALPPPGCDEVPRGSPRCLRATWVRFGRRRRRQFEQPKRDSEIRQRHLRPKRTSCKLICEGPVLEPYLNPLLSAKDTKGQTLCLFAVTFRVY